MRKCSPNWVDTYVDHTRHTNPPTAYHTWTALSVLASTLQRNLYLPRGFYKLFPNLYICLIGPTGFAKTTAADIGINRFLEPVLPMDQLIRGKATSWFLYDWFGKRTASKAPCVCTIYSGEMKNLLGDLNKTELVTLLTDLYTSPDKTAYHTKTGTNFQLHNVAINMLTCSTPEWLTTGTTTDEISGGFTGRFVYVFADTGDSSIAFPEDYLTPDVLALGTDLLDDLKHIATLKGVFIITDQAKAEYIVWYSNRKQEWNDERLIGYYARKGDLVLKLSMLLSISRDSTLVIDECILTLAWTLLKQLEKSMAGAFVGVVDDPVLRYKDLVLGQISRAPGHSAARSEILKKNWNRFDGLVLDRIVTNLIETRTIRSESITIGKETEVCYKLRD